jgi:hypothetical protein
MFSEDYLNWVKTKKIKNITNTQSEFAQFLFKNKEQLQKIGDLTTIFKSIRTYLKENNK